MINEWREMNGAKEKSSFFHLFFYSLKMTESHWKNLENVFDKTT